MPAHSKRSKQLKRAREARRVKFEAEKHKAHSLRKLEAFEKEVYAAAGIETVYGHPYIPPTTAVNPEEDAGCGYVEDDDAASGPIAATGSTVAGTAARGVAGASEDGTEEEPTPARAPSPEPIFRRLYRSSWAENVPMDRESCTLKFRYYRGPKKSARQERRIAAAGRELAAAAKGIVRLEVAFARANGGGAGGVAADGGEGGRTGEAGEGSLEGTGLR